MVVQGQVELNVVYKVYCILMRSRALRAGILKSKLRHTGHARDFFPSSWAHLLSMSSFPVIYMYKYCFLFFNLFSTIL